MQERNLNLILTPLHPFTPRQGQVLELRANDYTYKQIGRKLGMNPQTAKKHVSGEDGASEKFRLGIYGICEKVTGEKRPNCAYLACRLIGDVLFYADKLPTEKFVTKGGSPLVLSESVKQILSKEV